MSFDGAMMKNHGVIGCSNVYQGLKLSIYNGVYERTRQIL